MWNNQKQQQKLFSFMSTLQTYYHFELHFPKATNALVLKAITVHSVDLIFIALDQIHGKILHWWGITL